MNKNREKVEKRSFFRELMSKSNNEIKLSIFKEVEDFLSKFIKSNTKENKYIGIYWPIKGEVDLRPLKTNFEKSLALPASHKNGLLTYHPWLSRNLQKDFNGIPSPLNHKQIAPKEISLLLIPALAVDNNGIRLGYGGGYFDRLRAKKEWNLIPAYVILPRACISKESLPRESWDIPFNGWINEEGLTKLI